MAELPLEKSTFTDPRCVSPVIFEQTALGFGVHPSNVRALLSAIIGSGELEPAAWVRRGVIPQRLATQIEPLPALELQSCTTSRSIQRTASVRHESPGEN